MTLTDRQQDVVTFIRAHGRLKGYPPTIREIGKALGIRSTNGVNDHLVALEKKGVIRRDPKVSRGIVVLEDVA